MLKGLFCLVVRNGNVSRRKGVLFFFVKQQGVFLFLFVFAFVIGVICDFWSPQGIYLDPFLFSPFFFTHLLTSFAFLS